MANTTKTIEVEIADNDQNESQSLFIHGSRDLIQQLSPSAIRYSSEHELHVENNYVRTFVINGYPSKVALNWLDPLYSFDGDIDISVHIEPTNDRVAIDELSAMITKYETQLLSETEKGSNRNITNLNYKIQSLYAQRERIEQTNENMFHVASFFALFNRDLKQLDKNAQKFQSRLSGRKIGAMPLTLRQDDGYKSVAPYGQIAIPDYYRSMNTGALSTMFPFYNSEINHPNGTMIGINKLRNTPVFIDFFNRKMLGNANLCIFGSSGSGKTYTTSLLILRSALESVKTCIIDPEGEYGDVTNAVNGISFNIGPGSENCVNPFDLDVEVVVDRNGQEVKRIVNIKSKAAELLSLFDLMLPGMLGPHVNSDITHVIMKLYEDFGFTSNVDSLYETIEYFDSKTGDYVNDKRFKKMPILSDFVEALIKRANEKDSRFLNDIAAAFEIYRQGGIYDVFDRHTTIDMSEFDKVPVVRFNIQDIEDDSLRPIAMSALTIWIWNRFIKKDLTTKKRIVSDETWLMLKASIKGSNHTSLFLEKCARRIRKYNGSLCCASQNFKEFAGRDEGQAILSNSAVKMFLKQSPEDIDIVGDNFLLSDGEKEFLLSATRGEVLVKTGADRVVLDIFAFPFEDELISKTYLEEDDDEE